MVSRLDYDHFENNPIEAIEDLRRRSSALERNTPYTSPTARRHTVSDYNVANPPTNLELDAAFGTPEAVGHGFIGIVDDNGAGTAVWLVVAVDGAWWYEQLTKAV